MTGEVATPPAPEASSEGGISAGKEEPPQPLAEPAKTEEIAPVEKPADEEESLAQQAGVFGGWRFDVNAVAGNIGGFFGAGDDEEDKDEDEDEDAKDDEESPEVHPEDDIGATAANIATVATAELEHASKAAQETIGKAAQELGKGWGTLNSFLDDMLAAKPDVEKDGEDDADVHNTFQKLFPELDQDDQVVDHFKCALLQKYRCYLNNSTPEKAYALRGRLFVSTSHIAMYITDDGGEFGGKPFGISIPFQDVGKIQKGAKAMLRLVTKSQSSYIFADFESDSHFTGALSLLEHMAGAAAPPPKTSAPDAESDDVRETPATG